MGDTKPEGEDSERAPDSSGRSSRRERGIERTRRDILDAAARAFARRGFHGTTMEVVAQEAGYSVGSLYTYFKGKLELYVSLHEAVSAEIDAALDQPVPASLTFRQRFELRLIRVFAVVEGRRELLSTYVAQRAHPDFDLGSELGDVHTRMHTQAVERWSGFLQEGVEQGEVRLAGAAADVAPFILATVGATIMNWARTNPAGSLTNYTSAVASFIFDGIGTGERGPLPSIPDDQRDDSGERGERP